MGHARRKAPPTSLSNHRVQPSSSSSLPTHPRAQPRHSPPPLPPHRQQRKAQMTMASCSCSSSSSGQQQHIFWYGIVVGLPFWVFLLVLLLYMGSTPAWGRASQYARALVRNTEQRILLAWYMWPYRLAAFYVGDLFAATSQGRFFHWARWVLHRRPTVCAWVGWGGEQGVRKRSHSSPRAFHFPSSTPTGQGRGRPPQTAPARQRPPRPCLQLRHYPLRGRLLPQDKEALGPPLGGTDPSTHPPNVMPLALRSPTQPPLQCTTRIKTRCKKCVRATILLRYHARHCTEPQTCQVPKCTARCESLRMYFPEPTET